MFAIYNQSHTVPAEMTFFAKKRIFTITGDIKCIDSATVMYKLQHRIAYNKTTNVIFSRCLIFINTIRYNCIITLISSWVVSNKQEITYSG